MLQVRRLLVFGAAFACAVAPHAQDQAPAVTPPAAPPPFAVWLAELRTEALTRGIRSEIVDAAFNNLQPVEQILERDRTQAEFALDLTSYLKRRLTPSIVRSAQQLYTDHRQVLQGVSQKYGVQPKIITAVWGLESNFGRFAGVRPTIPALATLAYD